MTLEKFLRSVATGAKEFKLEDESDLPVEKFQSLCRMGKAAEGCGYVEGVKLHLSSEFGIGIFDFMYVDRITPLGLACIRNI